MCARVCVLVLGVLVCAIMEICTLCDTPSNKVAMIYDHKLINRVCNEQFELLFGGVTSELLACFLSDGDHTSLLHLLGIQLS